MCTVSYIVVQDGYILTSSRDEDPARKTLPPQVWMEGETPFTAPRDLQGRGTWCATDNSGRSACLLNGGFQKHRRTPPYKRSRGVLIPEAFGSKSFFDYCQCAELDSMEPFTLILIDEFLQVLTWDGKERVLQFLSKGRSHLWSSASLYSRSDHLEKLHTFQDFLKNNRTINSEKVLQLHGLETPTNFVLSRPGVRTVSITQVAMRQNGTSAMEYFEPEYH